jgi:hypothetical protein
MRLRISILRFSRLISGNRTLQKNVARNGVAEYIRRKGLTETFATRRNFCLIGTVSNLMRFLWIGAAALLSFASSAGIAQNSGTCAAPFEAPLKSGAALSIDSRSADIQVVGTDQEVVRVSCTLDHPDQANEIDIRLSGAGSYSKLKLKGGPSNNVHIRIEVPRAISLKISAPAGVVGVDRVTGNKDIDIHAGVVTVSHVDGSEYKSVDAAVGIGEVRALAFGIDKGGFFRKFTKETAEGKYRLYARVGTGSIEFN